MKIKEYPPILSATPRNTAPKIAYKVQYSIEKCRTKSTIFSRELSKNTYEELKRYDKDHISCHKLTGWTHDKRPI